MTQTPQFASFLGLETRAHNVKQQVRNVTKKTCIYNSFAYQMGDTMAYYAFETACITDHNRFSSAKADLTRSVTCQQLVCDHVLRESFIWIKMKNARSVLVEADLGVIANRLSTNNGEQQALFMSFKWQ